MLGIIPILSRPSILTFKNNWSKQSFANKQFWRDLLVLACVTYLLFGLYKLSDKGFSFLYRHNDLTASYLPAVFNALSFTVIALVFFSSCTFSLNSLFLADDLELILASPISKFKFFFNKFIQIFLSSCWIIYIGALPCVIAIGKIYGADASFYSNLVLLSIPLLAAPVALAIICTTLITRYLSGNHLRILLPTLTVFLLLSVFSKSHLFFNKAQKKDIGSIIDILKNLEEVNSSVFSFSWIGQNLTDSLLKLGHGSSSNIITIYLAALAAFFLSYFCVSKLHGSSLTRLNNASKNLNLSSRHSQKLFRLIFPLTGKPFRGTILKEFKIFARDFSHLIQISLILIICMFYLYNFQNVFNTKDYFTSSLLAWQYVTFLCNIAFGSLILTSLCTRFVYSSISLEGKSFWVMTSSPLTIEAILKNKFKSWYVPILIFSLVILVSGCFALQSDIPLIVLTVVAAVVTSYSTTALAIGLGSVYANFNWVHNAQVFASSGSLIFIFTSLLLTTLNLLILTQILFLDLFRLQTALSDSLHTTILTILALTFVIGNYLSAKLFLRLGASALKKKHF